MRTSRNTLVALALIAALATPATFAASKQTPGDRDGGVIERVIRAVRKVLQPTIMEQPIIPLPNPTTTTT